MRVTHLLSRDLSQHIISCLFYNLIKFNQTSMMVTHMLWGELLCCGGTRDEDRRGINTDQSITPSINTYHCKPKA
jgi:hypothetical protein